MNRYGKYLNHSWQNGRKNNMHPCLILVMTINYKGYSFFPRWFLIFCFVAFLHGPGFTQQLYFDGKPAQLDIRQAGEHSIRITLKPVAYKRDFPFSPALTGYKNKPVSLSVQSIKEPVNKTVGSLNVFVNPSPLTITIKNKRQQLVQQILFSKDGNIVIRLNDQPVLGLGEGGSKPDSGVNWRILPVEFDRRGITDKMQPRWQSDAYGSRNPVPLLIGTDGWAIFVSSPWIQVDLKDKNKGILIPWKPTATDSIPQNEKNQGLSRSKGLPPVDSIVAGLFDLIVFDAHDPSLFLKDFADLSGHAAMPPKWALGYMQSHRTLEDDTQMIGIIDTFRAKRIPVDAVIYLGTGFTPRGWNTLQPSFNFNPEVFKRDPKDVISDMHNRNIKVVLHMVPWDRNRLPTLHGNIPPLPGEVVDSSHISSYWNQHVNLVNTGVDAFWPDEGDWFNLFERIKRHQLYYQGSLSTHPNIRPWSLQRNGFPGIAQWGGWVWSGDTEASWKTLEAQVAVGINYSLSIGPFWGSDIGGFYATPERTGELYARWFQFGSFCGSFRAHGRTWKTILPWGWGLKDMGITEMNNQNSKTEYKGVLPSEMNNPLIEPVVKKYDELRYRLMPYTYTLAWQARTQGLPLMRALWIHYPEDATARKTGDEYLWGRDLLIAPVFKKGASEREVYLPEGNWYDWWSHNKIEGGLFVSRHVDLATMPIYARAGAIIPFDTVRQYTSEPITSALRLKIFTGANGHFVLYEDDGVSMDYLKNKYTLTSIDWDDNQRKLIIQPAGNKETRTRKLIIELIPYGIEKEIMYKGSKLETHFSY